VLPEIATVPAGRATRVPANGEPSDIDTAKVATIVPASEVSGRDTAEGMNAMPVGVPAEPGDTVTIKFPDALKTVPIPVARISTE
jgi:hypothetical protein